jgi:oligopeptide/dipeptide ABC transporter ATP-binding protein
MTLLGLTRSPKTRFDGKALYKGVDLIALRDDELRRYRGRELAMIFQDPMTSLNPVVRIGDQIVEMIRAHESISRRDARRRAVDLLAEVGIPHAEKRVDSYPHEFSGGMRQRTMIAMALACNPEVLIADEPTTALDVTIQSQIIQLIARLRDARDASVILITHDLGVIADIADEVLVMYAGRVVERGSTRQIFYSPQHPYTWGLLGSIPRLDRPRPEKLYSIPGSPPSLIAIPQGCRFRPRCAHAFEHCLEEPALESRGGGPGQLDRCWLDAAKKTRLRGETLAPVSASVGGETL